MDLHLESPLDSKEIQPVHPKGDQSRIFIGRTDAKPEIPILWPPDVKTHWKRPWCWERLKAGGEGDDRGWVGWMASQTQWTWDWINSRSWWWTGRPGVPQPMGSQRVGDDRATELNIQRALKKFQANSKMFRNKKFILGEWAKDRVGCFPKQPPGSQGQRPYLARGSLGWGWLAATAYSRTPR